MSYPLVPTERDPLSSRQPLVGQGERRPPLGDPVRRLELEVDQMLLRFSINALPE